MTGVEPVWQGWLPVVIGPRIRCSPQKGAPSQAMSFTTATVGPLNAWRSLSVRPLAEPLAMREPCTVEGDILSRTLGPRIVALEVGRYKNLQDLWIPWNDGLALFGPNGAGKTNLLECLALLMGSAQAVGLAGPRLAHPSTDDLAVLVRPGQASLPWPPDLALKWWIGGSSHSGV